MKRRLWALVFIASCAVVFTAPVALSQTKTIVSATVVDPNGVPYAGGTVATQLVPTGGTPTINNVPVNVQNNPAAIDMNGHFTVSLWCNTAGGACSPLDQPGTQWQFTITNPGAQPPVGFGGVSFTVSVTITGTTQDISSTLNAAAVLLYRDGGVTAGCTVSGSPGNLLFVNGTSNGCTNSNKLNYNSGTDVVFFSAANQGYLAGTSITMSGGAGNNFISMDDTNGVQVGASDIGAPNISETATGTISRAAPSIFDQVGSAAQVTPGSVTQRAVTTTSDTIQPTDRQNRVVYNSASAVAVALPTQGSSGFAGGFNTRLSNQNTGTVTVTPATGTINGNATLVLLEGQDCFITPSSTGTNWAADCNEPQMTAGANVSITRGVHSITIGLTGLSPAPATLTPTTNLFVNGYTQGTGAWSTSQVGGNSLNGAASTSAFILTGTPFTGGTGNTTFPFLYVDPSTASAPTGFSTNGEMFAINVPAAVTGRAISVWNNGGASPTFSVAPSGGVVSAGSITAAAGSLLGLTGRGGLRASADGVFTLNNNANSAGGSLTLDTLVATTEVDAGVAGTTSGVLGLNGSASGKATITAPATAGTSSNAFLLSNAIKLPAGTAANTAIQFPDGVNYGFFDGAGNIIAVANGHDAMAWRDVDISAMPSQGNLGWTASSGDPTAALDTNLSRGAAATVDVGNGTAGNTSGTLIAATLRANSGFSANGTAGISGSTLCSATITYTEGLITACTATSDPRLKTFHPYLGGLKEVLAIDPIGFRWNEEGLKVSSLKENNIPDQIGFNAANVKTAIPAAVGHDENGYLTLPQGDRPIVAALVNAVKEQQKEIDQLKKLLAERK